MPGSGFSSDLPDPTGPVRSSGRSGSSPGAFECTGLTTSPGYRPQRMLGSGARRRFALLLDLGGLAAEFAQVVQLGPADVTAPGHLDLGDVRGVHREGALDADVVGDLADREGLADAAALAADDHAQELLDPGARALDDADVDIHGVARPEVRDVGTQRLGVQ